ncbi:MAG: hypothetical protein QNJ41_01665 [Xenococcaceae cyanobacterium MO_188.B32]|nr:hypothetical protein [Xenococcaceae cyanobacterium MO_188.B32]
MDLFEQSYQQKVKVEAPLAERMRPRTLDEFVGQAHIIGAGRLLRRAILADQLSSLIFFGPPGTGKTTNFNQFIGSNFFLSKCPCLSPGDSQSSCFHWQCGRNYTL